MTKCRPLIALLAVVISLPVSAQQADEGFDYWGPQREMISRGVQAILQCNGLFTSNRTIDQVFAQELRYLPEPIGTADGGDYVVDNARRAVAIGAEGTTPVMRAAFRDGVGCVIMAPDQTFDDIDSLPSIALEIPGGREEVAWPDGDMLLGGNLPRGVDWGRLSDAVTWAFERESEEQVTLSLLVVYQGQIVAERYAEGVEIRTRTRTWSTAKSIAATLIGQLYDRGDLALDAPLDLDWLPDNPGDEDPRDAITLRHVLNMSSGLETVDNQRMEYATGSGLAYWAGASSVEGATSRALIREPGSTWDYENYDTLLAVLAMKQAIGDDEAYRQFPYESLLHKIGMYNTLLSTDRFGDFILSSQVYTNARDLARFGLLYLNGGVWNGERLLSEAWIEFVRTPAPSTAGRGNYYGGQWWLVPDDRDDVPKDAYSTAGNRGQYVVVVPSHDLVIVRRGLDYGRQGFNRWDLAREVVKAFPASN